MTYIDRFTPLCGITPAPKYKAETLDQLAARLPQIDMDLVILDMMASIGLKESEDYVLHALERGEFLRIARRYFGDRTRTVRKKYVFGSFARRSGTPVILIAEKPTLQKKDFEGKDLIASQLEDNITILLLNDLRPGRAGESDEDEVDEFFEKSFVMYYRKIEDGGEGLKTGPPKIV